MTNTSSLYPNNLLTDLRDLLHKHFNENELRDLCFNLHINYEDLAGQTRTDKARELVEYCERHGRLSDLWQQIKKLRPSVFIDWLDREDWLKTHGFPIDPFAANALRAEDDPLFKLQGLPAFVDLPNFELLRGTPASPGYRFIFAPAGGGKTSLRQRILYEFAQGIDLRLPGKPFVLAVEYIDHEYDLSQSDAYSHAIRICHLIVDEVRRIFQLKISLPTEQSARVLLQGIVAAVKDQLSLDGICILIDNLDIRFRHSPTTIFDSIRSLITGNDLFGIEGLMFKFLLPSELQETVNQSLVSEASSYLIQWDKERLAEVLRLRLLTCMEEKYLTQFSADAARVALTEICDETLRQTLAVDLVEFAFCLQRPQAMWELGHSLLEEHFNQAVEYRRPAATLLNRRVFIGAIQRLLTYPTIKTQLEGCSLLLKKWVEFPQPESKTQETNGKTSQIQDDNSLLVNTIKTVVEMSEKLTLVLTSVTGFNRIVANILDQQQQIESLRTTLEKMNNTITALTTTVEQFIIEQRSKVNININTFHSFSLRFEEVEKAIENGDQREACRIIKASNKTKKEDRRAVTLVLSDLCSLEKDFENNFATNEEKRVGISKINERILLIAQRVFDRLDV